MFAMDAAHDNVLHRKFTGESDQILPVGISRFLVGANSCWRPGTCTPMCTANHRQETVSTFVSVKAAESQISYGLFFKFCK